MDKKEKQLLDYQSHLSSWNKTHNLVSKSQEENIYEHIEDSLSIGTYLGKNIIDLGSGGGLPGIPLAIMYPKKNFYLVESNTKKSAFLLNATTKLNLANTHVFNTRIENLDINLLPETFDIVVRAVGTTEFILNLVAPLLRNKGTFLKLMKTENQFSQENIPNGYIVKKVEKYPSKAKDKTRILVTIYAE